MCVLHAVARPAQDLGLNSAASSSLCQLPSPLPWCRQEETQVFLVLSSCRCLATATRPFCRHGNYVSDSGGGQGELFFSNNPPIHTSTTTTTTISISHDNHLLLFLLPLCRLSVPAAPLISTRTDISLAANRERERLTSRQPFLNRFRLWASYLCGTLCLACRALHSRPPSCAPRAWRSASVCLQ